MPLSRLWGLRRMLSGQGQWPDFRIPPSRPPGLRMGNCSSLTTAALLHLQQDKHGGISPSPPAHPSASNSVPPPSLVSCGYFQRPCEGADVTTSVLEVKTEAPNGSNLLTECGKEEP